MTRPEIVADLDRRIAAINERFARKRPAGDVSPRAHRDEEPLEALGAVGATRERPAARAEQPPGWLTLSWFRGLRLPRALRVGVELERFVGDAAPHHGPKEELPLWSPAIFRGDRRALANVEQVTALVLDIDAPHPSVGELAELLAAALPLRWHLHTSYSSAGGALKFRALVPLSRAMTAEEHRRVWPAVAEALRLGGVEVDPACKDASRAYFVPAIPPSGIFEARTVEGEALDVDAWLATCTRWRAEDEARAAELARMREVERSARRVGHGGQVSALDRARAYVAAVPGAVSGQGGHRATFVLAARLTRGFALSDDEALMLMTEWNSTCRPPWSRKELLHKIASARAQAQIAEGYLLDAERRGTS